MGSTLFCFVTIYAFDRQTDRQLSPDCGPAFNAGCSAVRKLHIRNW